MANLEDMIQIVDSYERDNLSWVEAAAELRRIGVSDHMIKEALGNEPEEI